MAIPTGMVGSEAGPIVQEVDARWTMAHAASIEAVDDRFFDTTQPDELTAHPLFPVCFEWPVILEARKAYDRFGVGIEEVMTGVHATHDMTIHRAVRPGDVLSTSSTVVGVVNLAPGAMVTTRLETVDSNGQPVVTTTQGSIHLGVPAIGDDQPDPSPPPRHLGEADTEAAKLSEPLERRLKLDRGRAHIYTEGARIWNPIHTDKAVAQMAGLPDIILHGTANLGYGVSGAMELLGIGPAAIRGVRCRFRAMVLLPSEITVRVWPGVPDGGDVGDSSLVRFEVLNASGEPAVESGVLVVESSNRHQR